MTGLSASQWSSIKRLCGPQLRCLAPWASLPTVTKGMDRLLSHQAVSLEDDGLRWRLRQGPHAGTRHERQERVKFLIGLERAVAQLADRGDRVRTGRVADQL